MADDWGEAEAGEGDLGLGDLGIPDVELPDIPEPTPTPAPAPARTPAPQHNAWTASKQSSDVRRALRGSPGIGPGNSTQGGPPNSHGASFGSRFGGGGSGGGVGGGVGGGGGPMGAANAHYGSRFNSGGSSQASTLYITNLPANTDESLLVDHFRRNNFSTVSVNITRHSDSGNVKAALVQLQDPETANAAVAALNERPVSGRNLRIKIDGSDRRSGGFGGGPPGYDSPSGNRRSYGSGGFGGNSHRDGGGYGSGAVGNNSSGFSRERKGYGGASGHFEPAGMPSGRGSHGGHARDGTARHDGGRERRAAGMQADDPTIPVGPPPEGRKRLQLKPRTKPPPKLEIDERAIDSPSSHQGNTGRGTARAASRENAPQDGLFSGSPSRNGTGVSAGEGTSTALSGPGSTGPRTGDVRGANARGKDGDESLVKVSNAFEALATDD